MAQAPTGHVYRMSWWLGVGYLVFCGFGALLLIGDIRMIMAGPPNRGFVHLLLYGVITLGGAGAAARRFSSTVWFTDSMVEQWSIFGSQCVSLAAIRGRREYVAESLRGSFTRHLRIVSTTGSYVDFPGSLYFLDDAFWAWFRELPDLDAEDQRKRQNPADQKQLDSNQELVQGVSTVATKSSKLHPLSPPPSLPPPLSI